MVPWWYEMASFHGRYMGMAVHNHLTRAVVCVWVTKITELALAALCESEKISRSLLTTTRWWWRGQGSTNRGLTLAPRTEREDSKAESVERDRRWHFLKEEATRAWTSFAVVQQIYDHG
jgi:hypothetical protein